MELTVQLPAEQKFERLNALQAEIEEVLEEINADSTMTLAQRQRIYFLLISTNLNAENYLPK